jgi:16S rRNA (guanine527-N7)-methyltransferase
MKLAAYIDFLLAYNEKVNMVSKRSTQETLNVLVSESLLLKKLISTAFVIDAGSGGGLLGIPLAISFPEKQIVLTETVKKKIKFLKQTVEKLGLHNVLVWEGPIQEFMRRRKTIKSTIVARGFPHIDLLADYVYQKKVRELLLITSVAKITKFKEKVANIRQNLYNIPLKNNLIIFKLESVSRETLNA